MKLTELEKQIMVKKMKKMRRNNNMFEKTKENATLLWLDMIYDSWTWQKLTREEQGLFLRRINNRPCKDIIKGSFNQRYEILQQLYFMYLLGLGYRATGWRE